MSGKTDQRLHDRTKAADFGDRWAATFGIDTRRLSGRLRHNATPSGATHEAEGREGRHQEGVLTNAGSTRASR